MLSTQTTRIKSPLCQWPGKDKHPLRGLCKYVRGGAAQHSTHEVINSGRPTMSILQGNIILEHNPRSPSLGYIIHTDESLQDYAVPNCTTMHSGEPPFTCPLLAAYLGFPLQMQMHIVECQLACNYMYASADSASGAFGFGTLVS